MTTQTWIITGASRGLGRALAEAALAAGDRVVAAVRHPESMAGLHTGDLLTVAFDARDTATAPALIQAALERFGRLDVLVNNAGRAIVGSAQEVSEEQLRELMDLHLSRSSPWKAGRSPGPARSRRSASA
ncbi:SDR family NAD(P)-dependent oxidoreductase [Nonomuraea typhae]|uniref:SDR family NAD(P)-dependent oxidoreductase n=1 Tax=Nonomuraea typhae TaxID=2603600 RepID=UPI001CA5020A|nr:SDR family NAD(P)-dependent oxidoreductase [Nonomuraea typhae]